MIRRLILILCFVLCGCGARHTEGEPWRLESFVVEKVSGAVPACGVFFYLVVLDVASETGDMKLYIPYCSVDQFIPDVGSRCSAQGHYTFINGNVVPLSDRGSFQINPSVLHRYVESIECGRNTYSYDF